MGNRAAKKTKVAADNAQKKLVKKLDGELVRQHVVEKKVGLNQLINRELVALLAAHDVFLSGNASRNKAVLVEKAAITLTAAGVAFAHDVEGAVSGPLATKGKKAAQPEVPQQVLPPPPPPAEQPRVPVAELLESDDDEDDDDDDDGHDEDEDEGNDDEFDSEMDIL